MLIFKVKFQKKSAHLYTPVNRFICNIFDMIHSSNSILRSGGGGWGSGGVFFSGRYVTYCSLWLIWHQNKATWFQLIEYRFHHLNKLEYQSKHYLAPPKTYEIKNYLPHNLPHNWYFLPHNWPLYSTVRDNVTCLEGSRQRGNGILARQILMSWGKQ